MEFNKYRDLGDYHWREYKLGTTYAKNADKTAKWINEFYVLDIGAGDGLITHLLNLKGLNCIGIDDNEIGVKIAKEKGVPVTLDDAYSTTFLNDEFDAVLMADVIEHFEFPAKAVLEAKRVLKKNGYFYITTPPRNVNGGLHDSYHYREYTAKELQDFVEGLGFKLVEPIETEFVRMYAKFQKL